ncbi:MAG: hypothetical protein ACR2GL_04335 [Thermoleophilaceae bacterium]
MSFMDKAKKMAEQAQQKIDETQKQFNEGLAGKEDASAGAPVRYDEHGRPIAEPSVSAESPADTPAGQDAAADPPAAPDATSAPPAPAAPQAADDAQHSPAPDDEAPPAPPPAGTNLTPDPFKPIE